MLWDTYDQWKALPYLVDTEPPEEEEMAITSFDGSFRFLSNFFPSRITYEGITYPTVEHAFQAAKTMDIEERKKIAALPTPGKAKRAGRKVELRCDWEGVKIGTMTDLVRLKFLRDPNLRASLLATADLVLIEGNTWNDTFWGVCNGKGRNELGKILMKIREEIQP